MNQEEVQAARDEQEIGREEEAVLLNDGATEKIMREPPTLEMVLESFQTNMNKQQADLATVVGVVSSLKDTVGGLITSFTNINDHIYKTTPVANRVLNDRIETNPTDDEVSMRGSNASLQWGAAGGTGSQIAVEPIDHSQTKDFEECYWEQGTEDYTPPPLYGPELKSYPAQAARLFYVSPLSEDRFTKRMEDNLVPSNCTFLLPKRCNPAIFALIPPQMKSWERGIQDGMNVQSAASTALLKAASMLSSEVAKVKKALKGTDQERANLASSLNLESPLDALKESMSLGGAAHQNLTSMRKKLIKHNIPEHMMKQFDDPPEDPSMLFCEALQTGAEEVLDKRKKKGDRKRPASSMQDFRQERPKDPVRQYSGGNSTSTRGRQHDSANSTPYPFVTCLPSPQYIDLSQFKAPQQHKRGQSNGRQQQKKRQHHYNRNQR